MSIRRAKTEAKASQKTPVTRVVIAGPEASLTAIRLAEADLAAVGRIARIDYITADLLAVSEIELETPEA